MLFIVVISCAGGRLTLDATITGSVSRMMPSSTSSSIASDYIISKIYVKVENIPTTKS